MPYPKFDRSRLSIKKLAGRKNKVDIEKDHVSADSLPSDITKEEQHIINTTAERIRVSRKYNRPVIMAFGAHVIKNGLAPVLNALMEDGWITHLATNGAGIIHDWEFAFQGKSSEDVRENIEKGQFGIWEETGFYINLGLIVGAYEGLGYGESIGKMIFREGLQIPEITDLHDHILKNIEINPELAASATDLSGVIRKFGLKAGFMHIPHRFKNYSVQSKAYSLGIPLTGHPMVGHDIIYTHPMNHGAAIGRTSLNDFLSFAEAISNIDHGVYISLGSAVMSPMIFEKSFSMARNVKLKENRHIDSHFILVVDLAKSDWNWKKDGEPPSDNPAYYLRYCKTFSRMGGEMHYLSVDNRNFLLALYRELNQK